LLDDNNDEADALDEAFVLADENLRDDDFAEVFVSSVPCGTKVIIITDCCHSGTIADLGSRAWDEVEAISLASCYDQEESGDTGRGGVFTHALLKAVEALSEGPEYTVSTLWTMLEKAKEQHFDPTASRGTDARAIVWPLTPPRGYQAPQMPFRDRGHGFATRGGQPRVGVDVARPKSKNPKKKGKSKVESQFRAETEKLARLAEKRVEEEALKLEYEEHHQMRSEDTEHDGR